MPINTPLDDDDDFFDTLERLDVRVLNQAVEHSRMAASALASPMSSHRPSSEPLRYAPQTSELPIRTFSSPPAQPTSATPLPTRKSAVVFGPVGLKRAREAGDAVSSDSPLLVSTAVDSSLPTSFSSSDRSWVCERCTLINEANASRCAACEAKRKKHNTSSSPLPDHMPSEAIEVQDHGGPGVQCPLCTFLNADGAVRCMMCNGTISAAMQIPSDRENRLLPMTSAGAASVVGDPVGNAFVHALSDASGVKPFAVTSGGEDDEEEEQLSDDEDEDSDMSSSSEDPSVSDREDTVSEEEAEEIDEQESSDQLVQFLQNLDAYPAADLPYANTPGSMVEHGHLKPFQLQGLYWLLYREKRVPRPSQGVNAADNSDVSISSSSSLSPSSSSLTSYRSETMNAGGGAREADTQRNKYVESKVRGGIFADFMGLGKTRTLISLCECTRERQRLSNVSGSEVVSSATLIVAPTSLISQWISEIKKCVRPVPRVLHYTSLHRRKLSFFQIAENYDYVLVSYQSLRAEAFPTRRERVGPTEGSTASPLHTAAMLRSSWDDRGRGGVSNGNDENRPTGHLFMIKWNRIILDEAHYIRNSRSKQSRSCFLLTGSFRWAVTATPVQNSVNDVFPLMKFLQVPFFSNVKWWNQEIIQYFRRDLQHPRPTTALRLMFSALSLRRTPATLIHGKPLLDLPPMVSTCVPVELSPVVREFYNSVYSQANQKLQQITEASNGRQHGQRSQYRVFQTAFEMLIRCRQACLHPYLVVAALLRCRELASGTAGPPLSSVEQNSSASSGKRENKDTISNEMNAADIQRFIDMQVIRMIKRTQKEENRRLGTETDLCASEFVKDLIEALKSQKLQERECLICLEKMEAPGILPCGHSFCYECAIHALEHAHRCPTCKHPTSAKMVLQVPQEFLGITSSVGDASGTTVNADRPLTTRETEIFRLGAAASDLSVYSNWPVTFSNKTEALLRHLREIPTGEKCVVFSSFATYLLYLKEYLDKETNICSDLFTGSLSVPQKNKVLQRFRHDKSSTKPTVDAVDEELLPPSPTVLLATITSCGVGINLECANHVFLMDPNYNPGLEIQAIHRVHRMGQLKPVSIIKFIAANTIEENIEELRKVKASMSSYCFETVHSSSASGASHRLTTDELLTLFAAPRDNNQGGEDSESRE